MTHEHDRSIPVPKRASTLPVRVQVVNEEDSGYEIRNDHIKRTGTRLFATQSRRGTFRNVPNVSASEENLKAEVRQLRREREQLQRSQREFYYSSDESAYGANRQGRNRSRSREEIIIRRNGRNRYDRRSNGSESLEYSDDSSDTAYDFVIPQQSTRDLDHKITLGNQASVASVESDASPRSNGTVGTAPEVCWNVLSARYAGEGCLGGEHQANLVVVKSFKKLDSSLYRWVHFDDPCMSLNGFQNGVARLNGLSEQEKLAIRKLFNKIRGQYTRPIRTVNLAAGRAMKSTVLQEPIYTTIKERQNVSTARTITWVCLPYFSLMQYDSSTSSACKDPHPVRTLLQTKFAAANKRRDLQQVVCMFPGTEPDACYHVPQIWYLIVGDALLITCAAASMSTIQGKMITEKGGPIPDSPHIIPQRLLISYGASLLWSFALGECSTWLDLMSKFTEFWPTRVSFFHEGELVTAESWLLILKEAKEAKEAGEPHQDVSLELQVNVHEKLRTRGILAHRPEGMASSPPSGQHAEKGSSGASVTMTNLHPGPAKTFSVFGWLGTRMPSNEAQRAIQVEQNGVHLILKDMKAYFDTQTNLDDRLAYKQCPRLSKTELYECLRRKAEELAQRPDDDTSKRQREERGLWECKVDVFNAAEILFDFFMPPSTDEPPTTREYWGSLAQLLSMHPIPTRTSFPGDSGSRGLTPTRESSRDRSENLVELRKYCLHLEDLTPRLQAFKNILSQVKGEVRKKIAVPGQLGTAWLHVLMCSIYAAKRTRRWESHLRNAEKLIDEGIVSVMQSLMQKSLLYHAVVKPQEIATLTNLGFLRDNIQEDAQLNISETYLDYCRTLEADIDHDPFDRRHQEKLVRLRQEIAIIIDVLESQQAIFESLRTLNDKNQSERYNKNLAHVVDHHTGRRREYTYVPRTRTKIAEVTFAFSNTPNDQSQLAPTDPGGYRDLLVQECLDIIESKIRRFEELDLTVTDLEGQNLRSIDTNKDRQENAVYAFTIVTIIFLPLSTVAGILGMNVQDIRDMEFNQWVFWAVALPLLLVIIFFCLAWTGELGNFMRGLRSMFTKKRLIGRRAKHYRIAEYADDGREEVVLIEKRAQRPPRWASDDDDDDELYEPVRMSRPRVRTKNTPNTPPRMSRRRTARQETKYV